jgi:hypothetical protein
VAARGIAPGAGRRAPARANLAQDAPLARPGAAAAGTPAPRPEARPLQFPFSPPR